jgi:hypothetical protein
MRAEFAIKNPARTKFTVSHNAIVTAFVSR